MKDNAITFIEETEGKRPPVNDPRTNEKVRTKLTDEEIAKQNKITKDWEDKVKANV